MYELLKFNKKYYADIISGIKTQTIRKHNKKFKDGQIVKAIFPGTDKECFIEITHSGYKQFKYVNDDDAKREGYTTLRELREALKKIYPLLDAHDRLYYYQFKIVDSYDPE